MHREYSNATVNGNRIMFPKAEILSSGYEGTEKKQFKNCHNYNINSLSTSPDGENFLSSDDLCINLWNLEKSDVAYQVVDLKPPNIEELAEVITHVEYHPKRSDIFLFSSSNGYMCLCDMRISSQYRNYATKIKLKEDPSR